MHCSALADVARCGRSSSTLPGSACLRRVAAVHALARPRGAGGFTTHPRLRSPNGRPLCDRSRNRTRRVMSPVGM